LFSGIARTKNQERQTTNSEQMTDLFDTHCHLLAGLDDGPSDVEEAVEMCRFAEMEGVRAIAAVAHQNHFWPKATSERIVRSTVQLQQQLDQAGIPLRVVPCGEVMIGAELMDDWRSGRFVSMGGSGRYLLIEMPHGLLLEIGGLVSELVAEGIRPILAHPERYHELWHQPTRMVDWIQRGCLMQACADGILSPDRQVQRQLRYWLDRDWLHLIASDGHSLTARPPGLAAACDQLARWTNPAVAHRLCCSHPQTILEGGHLVVPQPRPPKRRWFGP
jgi:protein-tyrosine phosphatase